MPITDPRLHPEDAGKFVAIALRTDDNAIEPTTYDAVELIRARNPSGEVFVMRTDGSPAVRRRTLRLMADQFNSGIPR